MNLYDMIYNPLDDDKVLMDIVKMHSEGSHNLLYNNMVDSQNQKSINTTDYTSNFYKYICEPFSEIRRDNLLKREDLLNYYLNETKFSLVPQAKDLFWDKENMRMLLEKVPVHNLVEVFRKNRDDYRYVSTYRQNYNMAISRQKERGIKNETIVVCDLLSHILLESSVTPDSMGFHINPKILGFDVDKDKLEKTEMKFYVNAGADTYKVASLLWKKCSEKGINYRFKVVNPLISGRNECVRPDKLCIYMEYEHAPIFYEILQEIKANNPEIKFEEPPILTGRLDGFIGVGVDQGGSSYNEIQTGIIERAIEQTCPGIDRKNLYSFLQQNPGRFEDLKRKINSIRKKDGICEEKSCLFESSAEKLKKVNIGEKNKEIKHVKIFPTDSLVSSTNITNGIYPYLLRAKVNRTEDGKTVSMSMEQYIQKFIAPHIPVTGEFILKDGTVMPANKFIEQAIQGDFLTKYRGDIEKYLSEKTKANNGVIEVDRAWDKKYRYSRVY